MTAADGPVPGTATSRGRRALQAGAQPVKGVLAGLWRAAVSGAARDETAVSTTRRLLVLAPHPDDETIGCGATILRRRAAGTAVRVVVATDGRLSHRSAEVTPDELARIRAAEFREACSRLGVPADQQVVLGHAEGSLGAALDEVAAELRGQIDEFGPAEVLVTSALDWHEDHRMLSQALQLALRGGGAAPVVREYPVWAWAAGPWSNSPGRSLARSAVDLVVEPVRAWRRARPTYVRTGVHLEGKRHALNAYRSQLTSLTGEASWATFDASFLRLFLGSRETFLTATLGAR